LAMGDKTERVCDWTPPAHFFEHVDQDDHADTAQLTGQAWVLHACDCVRDGHAVPPFATLITMARVCV